MQEGARLVEDIKVPVLDTGSMGFGAVEGWTGLLVVGGFLYVAGCVVSGILKAMNKKVKSTKKSQ